MVVENFSNSIKMKSVSFRSISRTVWLSFSAQPTTKKKKKKRHRRWNVKWMLGMRSWKVLVAIFNLQRVNVRRFHLWKEWIGTKTMDFSGALKSIERIVFELSLRLKWSKTPTENFLMKIHNNKCGPSGYYWRVFFFHPLFILSNSIYVLKANANDSIWPQIVFWNWIDCFLWRERDSKGDNIFAQVLFEICTT